MSNPAPRSDREQVVDTLVEEWRIIAELLAELTAEEWAVPTDLPGWDVRDNISHLIGIESNLAGDPSPEAGADVASRPHVRNDLGAANEAWVESFRGVPVEEVARRFAEVTERRAAQLAAMSDQEFAAPSWTPVGQGTYELFMRTRILDCWFHEQDIRTALDRPGNTDGAAAAATLEQVTSALGYVVGKRAGAPSGTTVTFDLTGPLAREIHVVVNDRASVVPSLDRPADVRIRVDTPTFLRLLGGRMDHTAVPDRIALEGDEVLGEQVLAGLGYMI